MKKIMLMIASAMLAVSCQAAPTNAPTAVVKSVSMNASGQLTPESASMIPANGLITNQSAGVTFRPSATTASTVFMPVVGTPFNDGYFAAFTNAGFVSGVMQKTSEGGHYITIYYSGVPNGLTNTASDNYATRFMQFNYDPTGAQENFIRVLQNIRFWGDKFDLNGGLMTNGNYSGTWLGRFNLTNLPSEIVPFPVSLVVTGVVATADTEPSIVDGVLRLPASSGGGVGGVNTTPVVVSNAPIILQAGAYMESESGLLVLYPSGAFTHGTINYDPVTGILNLGGAIIPNMPTYMAASGGIWQLLSPASDVLFDNTDRAWLDAAKTNGSSGGGTGGSGLVFFHGAAGPSTLWGAGTHYANPVSFTADLPNSGTAENVCVRLADHAVTLTNVLFNFTTGGNPIVSGVSMTLTACTNAGPGGAYAPTGFSITAVGNNTKLVETNSGTQSLTIAAGSGLVFAVTDGWGASNNLCYLNWTGQHTP